MPSARFALVFLAAAGCADPCLTPLAYTVEAGPRDWSLHPPIVELDAARTVYAISDVHGGYERMVALLSAAQIIDPAPPSSASLTWRAGDAILIVAGDSIDKGPQSLEVIDALIALEASAALRGGRVEVLFGNHEAELLADPNNCKADAGDGLDHELRAASIDPVDFASGADPRGAWLRNRSFAARRGRWFFAHGGNTDGRSVDQLGVALREDVEAHGYAGPETIGSSSLLEGRGWYDDAKRVDRALSALDVDHIVFGHTPGALGPRGKIAVGGAGRTLRIDCGMSPNVDDSSGAILEIQTVGSVDSATEIAASGQRRALL